MCEEDAPMSGVTMSRCSIDLKPSVRGKGSLTERKKAGQPTHTLRSVHRLCRQYVLQTNPEKKKLICPRVRRGQDARQPASHATSRRPAREPTQAMIAKLGTIMTTCFFMPSIMPSIALGSVKGLGGAAFSGSIMLPSLSNEGLTLR